MTIETIELDQIAYIVPDESADSPLSDPSKPRLTNRHYEHETKQVNPVDPKMIFSAIEDQTGGWPKCAGGELAVVDPSGQLKIIKKETEFFAWLHDYFEIDWATSHCITKNEFFCIHYRRLINILIMFLYINFYFSNTCIYNS